MFNRTYNDDDDDRLQTSEGTFRVPDKDFYRKNVSYFNTVYQHFQDRFYVRSVQDQRFLQPHFTSAIKIKTPYGNLLNPADGVCAHYLR